MSHITTCKTALNLTNEQWIKKAIEIMKAEYPGITFEQKTPDMIVIRGYKPIEVYQTKGNLRFIRDPAKNVWDMQLDIWNCETEVNKVKKSFERAYPIAGVLAWSASRGYTQSTQNITGGKRITATKW